MTFTEEKFEFFSFWQNSRWISQGIVHGFIGSSLDFSERNRGQSLEQLKKYLSANALYLPRQTHSDRIISYQEGIEIREGDAVIANRTGDTNSFMSLIGVRTADCVPILLYHQNCVGVIHAGWRGLANGIIPKTIAALHVSQSDVQILIGPCAGSNVYEVGSEVITAIDRDTVVCKTYGDKYLLHLAHTAQKQLIAAGVPSTAIEILDICTITDLRFHSHRRDGKAHGSNLGFVGI